MEELYIKENGGTLTVWIYEDDLGVEKGKNIIHLKNMILIQTKTILMHSAIK